MKRNGWEKVIYVIWVEGLFIDCVVRYLIGLLGCVRLDVYFSDIKYLKFFLFLWFLRCNCFFFVFDIVVLVIKLFIFVLKVIEIVFNVLVWLFIFLKLVLFFMILFFLFCLGCLFGFLLSCNEIRFWFCNRYIYLLNLKGNVGNILVYYYY